MALYDEVNFEGVDAHYVTGIAGGNISAYNMALKGKTADVGKALTKTGEAEWSLTVTGGRVDGKLIGMESDGVITVQDEGYASFPTDGTTITFGAAADGLIGGATAGTVKSSGAAAGVNVQAIKMDGASRVYGKLGR